MGAYPRGLQIPLGIITVPTENVKLFLRIVHIPNPPIYITGVGVLFSMLDPPLVRVSEGKELRFIFTATSTFPSITI
jgi:hypothetical protein